MYAIGGFDEEFFSCTDRDLMIRFLNYVETHSVQVGVIPKVLSKYSAFSEKSVTFNKELKQKGLDCFYEKYKNQFSENELKKSLERAEILFGYRSRMQ